MNFEQWNETLEDTSEVWISAFERHVAAKSELAAFEKNVRKHGYQTLINQSNTQKMQLEFEHLIAKDDENWKHWQSLINDVNNTEVRLFATEQRHSVNLELVRLAQNGRI